MVGFFFESFVTDDNANVLSPRSVGRLARIYRSSHSSDGLRRRRATILSELEAISIKK